MSKSNQLYIIVVSDNGQISAIPKQFLICNDDLPVIGQTYQWYCPPYFSFKNIQQYEKAQNHWDKEMGTVLNMTGKLNIVLYQRWQIIVMLCAKNYLFILFFFECAIKL